MNTLSHMKFYNWLHESMDRWNPSIPTRASLINRLFINTIYPMLTNAGYSLIYNKSEMLNKFATWLHVIETEYYYNNAHGLIIPPTLHRDEQIDRDNWYLTFSDDVWYKLSQDEYWTNLLRSDAALSYFWSTLPLFLYRYIDVEHSRKCNKYDAEEAAFQQAEYDWMVEQGLIVEKKKGNDDIIDKPMGKYYD
jgi:hypothetical protein